MAVKIASRSDVCLGGYNSITDYTRITGLALTERQKSLILVITVCGGVTGFRAMGL